MASTQKCGCIDAGDCIPGDWVICVGKFRPRVGPPGSKFVSEVTHHRRIIDYWGSDKPRQPERSHLMENQQVDGPRLGRKPTGIDGLRHCNRRVLSFPTRQIQRGPF